MSELVPCRLCAALALQNCRDRLPEVSRRNVNIIFGSSGATSGEGTFRITLPVRASGYLAEGIVGSAYIRDASDGYKAFLCVAIVGSGGNYLELVPNAAYKVAHNVPVTFANNDQLFVEFSYEAAG